MKKVFFIDFDGTITQQDTCNLMAETFCPPGWKEINEKWEQRKISTTECALETLELMDISAQDLYRLLDTVVIDPFFFSFVQLCRDKGYELYILSDGYDLNIKYLLKKNGLSSLTFYANQLLRENDRFTARFPHLNPSCGQCGACKKALIDQLAKPPCATVYIGDGYSDLCASQSCDIIFAKNTLLRYCRENGIPALPFRDFSDIMRRLGDL